MALGSPQDLTPGVADSNKQVGLPCLLSLRPIVSTCAHFRCGLLLCQEKASAQAKGAHHKACGLRQRYNCAAQGATLRELYAVTVRLWLHPRVHMQNHGPQTKATHVQKCSSEQSVVASSKKGQCWRIPTITSSSIPRRSCSLACT